jgi:hypothetical protein
MSAAVLPATASQTVTWSVTNGTGSATVSTGGLLTAAANGTVTVSAAATDGSGVTGTLVITISGQIPPSAYAINIGSFAGGTVTASAHSATAGTAVTLTVTPTPGYELRYIWAYHTGNPSVSVPLHGSGGTRSFTMPAHAVTVEAAFEDPAYQSAWDAALALIEGATFTLTQAEAANEDIARYRLAELINALISASPNVRGFVISPYDIVIFSFSPALAGTEDRHAGVPGSFSFRVTPPNTSQSAYSSGAITPTAYDDTANEVLGTHTGAPLRAWAVNGVLHVSGLTVGELWSVYNLSGVLIYQGTAVETWRAASLPGRGTYIVRNGDRAVKVVY